MNDLIDLRKEETIGKQIVTLRGSQVILDRDLARLYQVEVSQMNRQVKRNIERFPEDFMFQLTKEELGVSMLAGLLRSDIAIKARPEWIKRKKHKKNKPAG